MSDAVLNLENAYFLADSAVRHPGGRSVNTRESRRDAKRADDVREEGVVGGINVVPNHHHTHPVGGGFHPVRYQGSTVRQVAGVLRHA